VDEDTASNFTGTDAAYSPSAAPDKYFRGRILHRLLELLPEIDQTDRKVSADRLLAKLAPDIDEATRCEWRDEVLSVLDHPDFRDVFAPGSWAEVSIAGRLDKTKTPTIITGQIDRLTVTGKSVLIVDYKTNRPPPADIKDASPAYITQMAAYRALLQEIYPDHQIDAALLWTWEARLMPVPPAMLDAALAATQLRD
jgi:ATP-dependent helicase/nuclease subunit A